MRMTNVYHYVCEILSRQIRDDLLIETCCRVVNEPVNLIVDSKDLPKDDDETLVTVEASVADITTDQMRSLRVMTTQVNQNLKKSPGKREEILWTCSGKEGHKENEMKDRRSQSVVDASDQGHLVSQILETQKELEDTTPLNAIKEASQRVDITWGSGRQEAVIREVDKLRSAIQALTRAANPLGKLIDFLQEDVESMQGELETWVANNKQLATQLQGEERLTEESIEPLVRQLEDIEQLIEEQLEETSVVKAAIIRNDERLTRLLHCNTSHLPG
ncbi:TRAF3-interacting protein 1 [Homalodisca vitripennis]|nr:TRAF3-interacting protein 1 [Homalodisca vitripennis]